LFNNILYILCKKRLLILKIADILKKQLSFDDYLDALTKAGLKKDATVLIQSGIPLFGKPNVKPRKKN